MVAMEMKQRPGSKITIPERCHPLAKLVFSEMRRTCVTYDELEWRSGVLRSTFKAWRTHNRPGLESIEAALGALGWQVTVAPDIRILPPALRADLLELASKHGLETLPCVEFIAAFSGFSLPGTPLTARRRTYPDLGASRPSPSERIPA